MSQQWYETVGREQEWDEQYLSEFMKRIDQLIAKEKSCFSHLQAEPKDETDPRPA